jgi:DNA-binding protein HU-beta
MRVERRVGCCADGVSRATSRVRVECARHDLAASCSRRARRQMIDIHHFARALSYAPLGSRGCAHTSRDVEMLDVSFQMRSTSLKHAHISEASVNKSELVDNISEGAGLSKADAERALNALLESVQSAVARDDKVTLPGFGSFSRSSRAARTGRNPRTGEPVQIAASKGVKFSAGAAFKSAVNK